MKKLGLVLWTAPAVILGLVVVLLAGCAIPTPVVETTCPGFERVSFGSGCRVATGQKVFVDKERCSICEEAPTPAIK